MPGACWLFVAVAAASPAIWPSFEAMKAGPGDAFDSPEDFAAHDVVAGVDRLAGLAVRLDCGEDDPFYASVRRLSDAFSEARRPETELGAGGHDEATWRARYPAQIDFFSRAFSAADVQDTRTPF